MNNPAVVVIGRQFCKGHPVELNIKRKMMSLNFKVRDVNGNIMFNVKGKVFSHDDRRVMFDAAGNPIITLEKKLMSSIWQVFRGESGDARDMLFSIKQPSLLEWVLGKETKLDVFLTSNTREDVRDFKIEDNWFEGSGAIYAGNSNNMIAHMRRKHRALSILLGNDSFQVTVDPNVDHAFVVALVVLLEEMTTELKNEVMKKIIPIVSLPADFIKS